MSDRQRKLKAARQKRWLENQENSIVVVQVPLSHAEIEALIAIRWVPRERSECRKAVAAGIAKGFAELAEWLQAGNRDASTYWANLNGHSSEHD